MATRGKKGTGSVFDKGDGDWVRGQGAIKLRNQLQEQADRNAMIEKIKAGIVPEMGADDMELFYNNTLFGYGAIDLHNPKSVQRVALRIKEYLELCRQCERVPTVSHLAYALGTNRTMLKRCADNVDATVPEEVCNMIAKFYTFLEGTLEQKAYMGEIDKVAWIFGAKNHFGYRDQMDIVATAGGQREESPEKLIAEAQLLGNGEIETDGSIE